MRARFLELGRVLLRDLNFGSVKITNTTPSQNGWFQYQPLFAAVAKRAGVPELSLCAKVELLLDLSPGGDFQAAAAAGSGALPPASWEMVETGIWRCSCGKVCDGRQKLVHRCQPSDVREFFERTDMVPSSPQVLQPEADEQFEGVGGTASGEICLDAEHSGRPTEVKKPAKVSLCSAYARHRSRGTTLALQVHRKGDSKPKPRLPELDRDEIGKMYGRWQHRLPLYVANGQGLFPDPGGWIRFRHTHAEDPDRSGMLQVARQHGQADVQSAFRTRRAGFARKPQELWVRQPLLPSMET